jgi:NAD(P)-dependent dehydrogenase (short-subunit alcohol dehydrogenase family)
MTADMQPCLGRPATGVIITGGASGIGLASARALAAVGRPVALWDLKADMAETAAQAIAADYGVASLGLGVDVRDPAGLEAALAASRTALPAIGGLVHSAGAARTTGIAGVTVEEWDSGVALLVRPLMLLVQALLPDFKRNAGSAVVALGSINAHLGAGGLPVYSAAKGAVAALVRSMADELGRDGIRINTVAPGFIDTPMVQRVKQADTDGAIVRRILLGRLGEPEEIGRLIRFLLSEEASYITAAEIFADGGNVTSQRA